MHRFSHPLFALFLLSGVFFVFPNISLAQEDQHAFHEYVITDKGIYFGDILIQQVDKDSFLQMPGNHAYAKDNNAVYFAGKKMYFVDPKTFQMFGENSQYAFDANGVYCNQWRLDEVDKLSAQSWNTVLHDKKSLYIKCEREEITDESSYEVNRISDNIFTTSLSVYFKEIRLSFIDRASFRHLGGDFFSDRSGVFYQMNLLPSLDPNKVRSIGFDMLADEHTVFFGSKRVALQFPFERIDETYIKDIKHVYRAREDFMTLFEADPKTFQIIAHGYTRDHDTIFVTGEPLVGVDIASFSVINYPYSKDKNHVYHYEEILVGADPTTFLIPQENTPENIDENIDKAEDQDILSNQIDHIKQCFYFLDVEKKGPQIYFSSWSQQEEIAFDAESFEVVLCNTPQTIFKDKNGVYHCIDACSSFQKIDRVDATTFRKLDQYLYQDKNNIFTYFPNEEGKFEFQIVSGVDAKTFQVIENGFAKDKQSIYLFNQKLRDLDLKTFELVKVLHPGYTDTWNSKPRTPRYTQTLYFKDAHAVYAQEYGKIQKLSGADPASFIAESYAKAHDAKRYYEGAIAKGGFPSEMKFYNEQRTYGHDGVNVYWNENDTMLKIPGADPMTFQVFFPLYAKDIHNVYFASKTLPGADPKTFQPVGYEYGKDASRVYHFEKLVSHYDAASFTTHLDEYTQDKNAVYFNDTKIEGADPKTFSLMYMFPTQVYGKDAIYLYYNGQKIEDVDMKSLKMYFMPDRDLEDDFALYVEGKRIPK